MTEWMWFGLGFLVGLMVMAEAVFLYGVRQRP